MDISTTDTPVMLIDRLLVAIADVRQHQRDYFAAEQGPVKKSLLGACKRVERECDEQAEYIGRAKDHWLGSHNNLRILSNQIVPAYQRMRDAQRAFFATRNTDDLAAARQAEGEIDRKMSGWRNVFHTLKG